MSVSDGELVDIDDGFAAGPSPNSPADGDIHHVVVVVAYDDGVGVYVLLVAVPICTVQKTFAM